MPSPVRAAQYEATLGEQRSAFPPLTLSSTRLPAVRTAQYEATSSGQRSACSMKPHLVDNVRTLSSDPPSHPSSFRQSSAVMKPHLVGDVLHSLLRPCFLLEGYARSCPWGVYPCSCCYCCCCFARCDCLRPMYGSCASLFVGARSRHRSIRASNGAYGWAVGDGVR